MRLIDADALMRQLEKKRSEPGRQRYTEGFNDALMRFRSMIHSAPTIDAEPVRYGTWVWFENWLESTPANPRECLDCGWQCCECKNALEDMVGGYWDNPDEMPALKHCPECGTMMDGGGNNEGCAL